MSNFRLLLFPFSVIYGLIILIRNKFYDWGIFKSTAFEIPIICVGNIAVGGSGKTPLTEYLVKLLADKKIAILSRGYGRKTKGFLLADATATAETIGDEPLQYYRKFKQVTVAVCEDRVKGVSLLKNNHDVILLDDAYQHRAIKAGFNILLFEFSKILKPQFLLPAGNLREPFEGYHRADQIVITKCPETLDSALQTKIRDKFKSSKNLSFSDIRYGELTHLFTKGSKHHLVNEQLFLLTGIANPKPLLNYLRYKNPNIKHIEYPDHYQFKTADIQRLVDAFQNSPAKEKIIVTTEKDSQRLLGNKFKELLLNLPIYYLPIEMGFSAADKTALDEKILTYVANA